MNKWLKTYEYDLYMVSLGILSFMSYKGLLGMFFLPIIVVLGIFLVIKKFDVLYIVPAPLFLQLGFSEVNDLVDVTTLYSVIFTLLIIFDAIKNRKFTQIGTLALPLGLLSISSLITVINAPSWFSWFAGLSQVLTAFVIYVFFLNAIEKNDKNYSRISKMFLYLGLFVTIEMFDFLYTAQSDIIEIIRTRTINLGWENINVVIYSNILAVPLAGYLVTHERSKIYYMLLAVLNIIGILLTLSRSSILTVAVMALLLVPYMLIKEKNVRKQLILHGVILIVIVIAIGLQFERYDVISGYFDSLFGRDLLRYSDRSILIKVAWDTFKEYPLFGSGGIYTSRDYLAQNGITVMNYHNTLAQVTTLGTLGVLSYLFLWIQKTRLLLKPKSDMKYYLLVLLFTTAFVNGSLQPMYFFTTYLVSIFLLIAIYEKQEFTIDEKKREQ